MDYRTGKKIVTGANQIESIKSYAIDPGTGTIVHTRQIRLTYDPSTAVCSSTLAHAPVRQLREIQESAWGVDAPRVDLPSVKFDYNTATTTLAIPSPEPIGTPWGAEPKAETRDSLGWGYRREDDRWPTVESMLVDLDGDGLQDLLTNTSVVAGAVTTCKAEWRRNTGPNPAAGTQNGHPQFSSTATPITLPRLKWGGTTNPPGGAASAALGSPQREGCSLNGQATVYENSDPGTLCHTNDLPCVSGNSPDPKNTGPYCYAEGTECPSGGDGLSGVFRTYLAYRWLDADSDGLTDLVTAVHGDIERYGTCQRV